MTLFEQLKLFPKVDLHIDFLGSITKDTIKELMDSSMSNLELDDILEFDSLKDYDKSRSMAIKLLDNLANIKLATKNLLEKLKNDNLIYAELFLNLDLFNPKLKKKDIIESIKEEINKSNLKINLVLEIDLNIDSDKMYDNLSLLYEYYNKGISLVHIKKSKQDNFYSYQALFDKLIKDKIDYVVILDTRLDNQNKEVYYNSKRIIYNIMDRPDDNFKNIIKDNEIILEFPITYQNYFNLYEELANHFVYDLFKENIKICFTTIDMTSLDTDLLNEYCKLFNVFPFNLHDLVNINLSILNKINTTDEIKNNLIVEFKEKANELL